MSEETKIDIHNLPLVVGVDLGGTQIRVAVLQGAKLLSRVDLLTGEDPTPKRIIPRIYRIIQQALDYADTRFDQIAGIGFGVAGPLDSRIGVVFAPPNLPGWDHVPLRDIFKEHYDVPIFIGNDANVAALGEYMFGAGQGCKDIVYLTVSTGIGGGVIINGKIMEGSSGTAAELGHMTIDWHGKRCNCGNIGCLESIASGTAIARRANEDIAAGRGSELLAFARTMLQHTDTVPDPSVLTSQGSSINEHNMNGTEGLPDAASSQILHVDARTVAKAAEAGIPHARSIITNAAEALGIGLVNIIHIFNPEMIILGGGLTQMGSMLMEPALRIVQERAMKVPCQSVRIVQAQLDADAGLVGAGTLVYYNYHNIAEGKLLQEAVPAY